MPPLLVRGQKHGFPLPDSGRVFPDTTEAEDNKTCIDVCAEFAGQQDCQTRCVRRVREHTRACCALSDADASRILVSPQQSRRRQEVRVQGGMSGGIQHRVRPGASQFCPTCAISSADARATHAAVRLCGCPPPGLPAHHGGRVVQLPGLPGFPGRQLRGHLRSLQIDRYITAASSHTTLCSPRLSAPSRSPSSRARRHVTGCPHVGPPP